MMDVSEKDLARKQDKNLDDLEEKKNKLLFD
jgi:hypothetical protein